MVREIICEIMVTVASVVVWRNGNVLVSINEVNLHWALLVLGWVIVSGFDSRGQHFISVCNQPHRSTQPSTLRETVKQKFSSWWNGRPFGHNRQAEKWGGAAVGGAGSPLGHHLTQCGLGRGLPLYQVASWSIQPFGHNCRNATLLREGIPLFLSVA